MEIVCKKCGYKRDLGKYVAVANVILSGSVPRCPECSSTDLKLVDGGGGVNIKIDGITEDVIVDIIKELANNISLTDIVGFFAKPRNQGDLEENK